MQIQFYDWDKATDLSIKKWYVWPLIQSKAETVPLLLKARYSWRLCFHIEPHTNWMNCKLIIILLDKEIFFSKISFIINPPKSPYNFFWPFWENLKKEFVNEYLFWALRKSIRTFFVSFFIPIIFNIQIKPLAT